MKEPKKNFPTSPAKKKKKDFLRERYRFSMVITVVRVR